MRKEVKIALVVVLVGVVFSAIYFFSDSEKTIEVIAPKPLEPVTVSPDVQSPSVPPPRLEEPVTITPLAEPETTSPKPVAGGESKAVWTIDLEPLTHTPTTRPVRMTEKNRQAKMAEMESAMNKIVPNQPISLEPELTSVKPETEVVVADVDLKKTQTNLTLDDVRKTHVVKSGDTLYQIAQEYYGKGEKWTLIADANPKVSPTKLRVGDKLFIPAASETIATSPKKVKETTNAGKSAATSSSGRTRTYKVRYGDTLEIIAHDQLGSSARWKEILRLNKKLNNDPMNLKADSTIILPAK